MEQARKQEAVEPSFFTFIKKGSILKKLFLVDCKANELSLAPIRPVEAEFVHICYDGPSRNDRLITEHPLAGRIKVIKPLFHR